MILTKKYFHVSPDYETMKLLDHHWHACLYSNINWKCLFLCPTCLILVHFIGCLVRDPCTKTLLCPVRKVVLNPDSVKIQNSDFLKILNPDSFMNLKNQHSLCSIRSGKRGPHQRVIGVSAYLSHMHDSKSISNLQRSLSEYIEEATKNYPDWVIRIYYFPLGLSKEDIFRIEDEYKNVDFCDSTNIPVFGNVFKWLPDRMHTFLPLVDPLVETYMSRNIDSPILEREINIVRKWMKSKQTIHIIRDHPDHSFPIVGGLWGIKVNKERLLINRIVKYLLSPDYFKCYHSAFDQKFLEDYIWPYVAMHSERALEYDSFFCNKYPNARPFSTRKESPTKFVGCRRPNCTENKHDECPAWCRPPLHPGWIWC